jgi:hypothetical protein
MTSTKWAIRVTLAASTTALVGRTTRTPTVAEDLLTQLREAIDATEAEALKHTDGGDEKESNYPCNPYLRVNRDWALRWVAAAREVLSIHAATGVCDNCSSDQWLHRAPCPTVRALAGVYGIGEG